MLNVGHDAWDNPVGAVCGTGVALPALIDTRAPNCPACREHLDRLIEENRVRGGVGEAPR